MVKPLLFLLCLFSITLTFAQNRAVIKGKLVDSLNKEPVELATIAVIDLKDSTSSLVSYTTSTKTGEFALHNLPAGVPLKVLITFVSYKPYRKLLTLAKGQTIDLGTIILSPKQLSEVTITGERVPIVMRKDTIEFNAEAFKTRPNAVVEDLLKKLPGIEVDNDGSIRFNGKKVSKIMVDGHEFFISDPRIATKNLDADLIDKVQVYDDREDDPDHLIDEANVAKIINLKFKKKLRKSTFGKVYAGAGTEGRYNAGGLINSFRDTLQISVLGQSNNLSNTGFSFNDLYNLAGLNRGGSAIQSAAFGGGGANGIQQSSAGGININTDYGKKLKLNLSYFYNHTSNNFNSITNSQQLLSDTNFITNSATTRNSINDQHNLSALLRLQPNDATQFTYEPQFQYGTNSSVSAGSSTSFSNFVPQINNSVNSDNNTGNNLQFQQSASYNHQFKTKGQSFNIDHNLQINPSGSDDYNQSNLTSYVSTLPSYSLNRYSNNHNNNISASLALRYRYPIGKKLIADVTLSGDYNQVISKQLTYDYDPASGQYDSFLLYLSSDLKRNQWNQHVVPSITYNINKRVSFVASLNVQWQNADNQFGRNLPDLNQTFFNLLPNLRFSVGSLTVSYSQSLNLPNIGDMIPYSIIYSPLYSVTGNPGLKPAGRDIFSINYNTFIPQGQFSIGLYGNFFYEHNGVFRERTLDADGAATSMPINKDGRYSTSLSVYSSKRFKKQHGLQLSSNTNLSVNQNHNFFEINQQDGYQNTYGINLNERLSVNWKDIVTMDPTYILAHSISYYTGVDYPNLTTTTHTVTVPFDAYLLKHTTIEGVYTYFYNPLVAPGFQKSSNLVNLSVARQFLKKDRGEIKLSCYDIFNQAVGSNRRVYENTITDTQSQILKRYFLLTLQYKFNHSVTK